MHPTSFRAWLISFVTFVYPPC